MLCTIDSETTGLHGVAVLLQYAFGDDEPTLYDIWNEKIGDTMDLLELIAESEVLAFNLAFDWFHISKLYTMFYLLVAEEGRDAYPINHISRLGFLEERARFINVCIKPRRCHDVMLHARKTKYQSLMERDDIKINRVPTSLAWELVKELEKRLKFEDIFFARSKDRKGTPRWKVFDIEGSDGVINPNFKTIKLKFRASSALKNLYKHVFKPDEQVFVYSDIEIGKEYYSEEKGYAPFALSIAPDPKNGNWGRSWPALLENHCGHWYHRSDARKYAANDVVYTRRLYKEEFGSPEMGDVDSTLAAMVACCRWHGYAVDIPALIELKREALIKLGFGESMAETYKTRPITNETVIKYGATIIAPRPAKKYILDAMDPIEKIGFQGSTKKAVLETISTWRNDDDTRHKAALRAQEVLDARTAKKEIEVYEKLLLARRFHASFKVIGTLSSRMAGDNGLNAQGIKHSVNVRASFPLADNDLTLLGLAVRYDITQLIASGELQITSLCGGDYKAFEVSIAAKVFDDRKLDAALMAGVQIHAIFAMELFPGKTYDEIIATKGSKTERDLYDIGKKGLFAIFYGAEFFTLMDRFGLSEEIATKAVEGLQRRFPGIRIFGEKIKAMFGALTQLGGIGTKVEWHEPAGFIESFLGFRRYFTLENKVMKCLFDLARDVPKEWRNIKIKVQRRERIQTPSGAVSSSLYGAAFGIMSRNIRAAKNHTIQSPGAEITKATQANIWSLQPHGTGPWIVQPMNVHDEAMCPTALGYESQVEARVNETVAHFKKTVPLLAIGWRSGMKNWSEK